jgi:hypothetical protein
MKERQLTLAPFSNQHVFKLSNFQIFKLFHYESIGIV